MRFKLSVGLLSDVMHNGFLYGPAKYVLETATKHARSMCTQDRRGTCVSEHEGLRHTPCRYMIATHAEVQRKVADELDALGLLATAANPHPRQLEYEDVGKLVYLNNCIKASLRWLVVQATLQTHRTTPSRQASCTPEDSRISAGTPQCILSHARYWGLASLHPLHRHVLQAVLLIRRTCGAQESLRMRPPVSGTMRTPVHHLRLGTYTLPPGTLINVNLGVMGNSARNYASPELYLPARPPSHTLKIELRLWLAAGSSEDIALAGAHDRATCCDGEEATAACAATGAVGGAWR